MLPGRGRAKRCNYSYNVPFTQEGHCNSVILTDHKFNLVLTQF